MEVRFEKPTHISSWNVHCIRNTGSPTSNDGRGTACYGNGSYDFTCKDGGEWSDVTLSLCSFASTVMLPMQLADPIRIPATPAHSLPHRHPGPVLAQRSLEPGWLP